MTKPMPKPFKLCYVRHNILYFTDNFEKQWGDDWDDAPYEHNAGEPYEWAADWTPEQNRKHGHAHIRYIAYMNGYGVCEPKDSYSNSPYSVEAINKGAVPWLYHETAGGLYAGATMEEAGKWLAVVCENTDCGYVKWNGWNCVKRSGRKSRQGVDGHDEDI